MSVQDNEAAVAAYLMVAIGGGVIGFLSGAISAYCYYVRLGGHIPL